MTFSDRVIFAVSKHWNIQYNLEEQLNVIELKDDWVIWRKQDAGKVGGKMLVVPKHGTCAFEIFSGALADDKHGISWEYEIYLDKCEKATKEAAEVLAGC